MVKYRAAWLLPIAGRPIAGGVVAIDRDTISGVGAFDGGAVEDLGRVAVLPGLVNAHTHLELSWMRDRVPPNASMPAWAASLIALRRQVAQEPTEPIAEAIVEALRSGTALLGDVANTIATYDSLRASRLSASLFREMIGFAAADPSAIVRAAGDQIASLAPAARVRCAIAAHAPYSVSAALLQAIGGVNGDRPFSIHLGESAQEIEFLRDGTGEWRALLERLGAWNPAWTPPGCGPVGYLDRLGLVNERLLAVHGVQFTDDELMRLAAAGATVVTCPRSNVWTGAGEPPIARFYASGVRVAIGTDSLASVADLNLFAEMAEVRRLAPGVPASRILDSATLSGARALGFGRELGSIEAGKHARLIAVRLPAGCEDVEEYLVGGVEPGDIQWLPDSR